MGVVAIPRKPGIQFNENGFDVVIVTVNDSEVYVEVYEENTDILISSTTMVTDLLGLSAKITEVLAQIY